MNTHLSIALRNCRHEVKKAHQVVIDAQVFEELVPLKTWLAKYYLTVLKELERLSYYLEVADNELFHILWRDLSKIQRNYRQVNINFLPAIHRQQKNDRFLLKILYWLHKQHDQTKHKTILIADSEFSILPTMDYPLLYSLPVTSQLSWLYIPLFFHEIGHYFYQHSQEEMDELVKEFQNKLEDYLIPPFQENNKKSEDRQRANKIIIETWYEWVQEFFCDAVGLRIGGPAYLHAFSNYLKSSGRSAFHIPEKDLAHLSHPVTWTRIQLLAIQADKLGLKSIGEKLEAEWKELSKIGRIREEYFGYFNEEIKDYLLDTIEDMLIEAAPILFTGYTSDTNPISLSITAWDKYLSGTDESFEHWESKEIETFLLT